MLTANIAVFSFLCYVFSGQLKLLAGYICFCFYKKQSKSIYWRFSVFNQRLPKKQLNYIAEFSVFSCVYEAKNSFFGLELSYDKKQLCHYSYNCFFFVNCGVTKQPAALSSYLAYCKKRL